MVDYGRQQRNWESVIVPLFPRENLVLQELVKLPFGLLETLNMGLVKMDALGRRPKNRMGSDLDGMEIYGLLVTDMTPDEEQGQELLEVKPKWLAQSPSAPEGWKRCRNCALRERRRRKERKLVSDEAVLKAREMEDVKSDFCPWDLVSTDERRLRGAIARLLRSGYRKAGRADELPPLYLVELIATKLREDGLLRRLKGLQQDLDVGGPLGASMDDRRFLTAMTIRDCTLYIRVSAPGQLETRLGDLDSEECRGVAGSRSGGGWSKS